MAVSSSPELLVEKRRRRSEKEEEEREEKLYVPMYREGRAEENGTGMEAGGGRTRENIGERESEAEWRVQVRGLHALPVPREGNGEVTWRLGSG